MTLYTWPHCICPLPCCTPRDHAGKLPPGVNLLAAAQEMARQHGAAALYRGNVMNVLRSAPARAVDFFAFDW
jgi:Mitochondrial carrier protein